MGAYGGPKEIMDLVAPLGPMYQAEIWAMSVMAAGCAMLKQLRDREGSPQLKKLSGGGRGSGCAGRGRSPEP